MKRKINDIKFEVILFILLIGVISLFIFSLYSSAVNGGVSQSGNATVITQLIVGEVGPEVLNVSVDDPITLVANGTKAVYCIALIRDWNNDSDINTVTADFFNTSTINSALDNNNHYYNRSCQINRTASYLGVTDTNYTAVANCSFNVVYYANPGPWNCSVWVNDSLNWNASNSKNATVNELLGIELPDTINYGTVNSTYISTERIANVSNAGNVKLNLSLSGYGKSVGDGLAMNCSLGSIGNISVMYEKFNLTATNIVSTLTQFENGNYTNLTTTVAVKRFDLNYRQNDTVNEAINSTYWRIYVPVGVAGSCTGNIVFGATKATGS